MDERYRAWAAEHVPTDPTGQCCEITAQMAAAFPELTRVRGHYQFSHREKMWTHWWLVTETGEIVDPTAAQWPDLGGGEYIPHDENAAEPTGKCHECGAYCYNGRNFCSDTCAESTISYLNSLIPRLR